MKTSPSNQFRTLQDGNIVVDGDQVTEQYQHATKLLFDGKAKASGSGKKARLSSAQMEEDVKAKAVPRDVRKLQVEEAKSPTDEIAEA